MRKILLALFILLAISCSENSTAPAPLSSASDKDTESFDSDVFSSGTDCTGDTKCSGNIILKCSDNKWASYKTCLATEACQKFGSASALCVDNSSPASALTLTLKSKREVFPAGVRVAFSVAKDNGMPVQKLSAKDITVINNETGKSFSGETPALSEATNQSFYTMLTLDMSDSIFTSEVQSDLKAAAKALIKKVVEDLPNHKKHKIAIYAFGSSLKSVLWQNFTNNHEILYSKIDSLIEAGKRGGTNLYGAYTTSLRKLREYRSDEYHVNLSMVLFSDSAHESGSKESMRESALASKDQGGVDIYTVALKGDYDQNQIEELASNTSNFLNAKNSSELIDRFEDIADITEILSASNYVIGVCSPVEASSSLIIKVNKDALSGDLKVKYNESSALNGDISSCNPIELSDPCGKKQCGLSIISSINCGSCGEGRFCNSEQVCENPCGDKQCDSMSGTDSLGYQYSISCGTCSDKKYCDENKMCVASCFGKSCGEDHGVSCGECGDETFCSTSYMCEMPECGDKDCGSIEVTTSSGKENVNCGTNNGKCQADYVCSLSQKCEKSIDLISMIYVSYGVTSTENENISVANSFYIGKYEVTFDEYDKYVKATGVNSPDDEGWGRGTLPVIRVDWYDAVKYANWLSEQAGLEKVYADNCYTDADSCTMDTTRNGYRLPTKTEWEYAARGGKNGNATTYSGSDTIGDVAWYKSNSDSKTHQVGMKQPNELGIYDMTGNVWEWIFDKAETSRYIGGGSWAADNKRCRFDYPAHGRVNNQSLGFGIRLVRTAE